MQNPNITKTSTYNNVISTYNNVKSKFKFG